MEVTKRKKYPSDIADYQWVKIKKLLPPRKNRGRKIKVDRREVVNAVAYRMRAGGIPWRMLPNDLPAWQTVASCFYRWGEAGVQKQVMSIIRGLR